MKLRLFLDEDVHLALAEALRKRGYDAVHVGETERCGQTDRKQLEFAIAQNRCIVSFNVGDFVEPHNEWMDAGIAVSKQLPIGESLRRVVLLLHKEDAESVRSQLRFL